MWGDMKMQVQLYFTCWAGFAEQGFGTPDCRSLRRERPLVAVAAESHRPRCPSAPWAPGTAVADWVHRMGWTAAVACQRLKYNQELIMKCVLSSYLLKRSYYCFDQLKKADSSLAS